MTTQANTQAGAFDQLLGELETMTKALPAADDMEDDEKIKSASGEDSGDEYDDEEGEGGMTKSFTVKLDDGTEVEAQDGTELVKSLMERIDNTEDMLAKALGSAINLIKSQSESLKTNTELVKSLQTKVAQISGEGRGRKALLSIHEKTVASTMAKSESDGMSGAEFMAKSHAAFSAGKINGKDLTVIDVSLRSNVAVDPSLVAKVIG